MLLHLEAFMCVVVAAVISFVVLHLARATWAPLGFVGIASSMAAAMFASLHGPKRSISIELPDDWASALTNVVLYGAVFGGSLAIAHYLTLRRNPSDKRTFYLVAFLMMLGGLATQWI